MKNDNVIVDKSKIFALRIIKAYKYLSDKKEYVLSKQMLRSGTSIGANVKEAVRAQTTPDFITKMNIALKEASETEYWIELLVESEYLTEEAGNSLKNDCVEPESVKLKNQISSKVSLQAKNKAKSSHSKCTQKVHENWKTPAFYAIIEVDKSGIGCGKNEL